MSFSPRMWQIADNKKKLLFVLRSSKTHGKQVKPQVVKIEGLSKKTNGKKPINCPFENHENLLSGSTRFHNRK